MSIDITEVKERLEWLGYVVSESDEVALQFCIDRTEEHIKNVCNLDELPDELKYKAVDMVCGVFLGNLSELNRLEGYAAEDNRLIKSITEGDTTVTYQDSEDRSAGIKALISGLKGDESELYSFRRLRW